MAIQCTQLEKTPPFPTSPEARAGLVLVSHGLNSRLKVTEERVSEFENRSIESIHFEEQKVKWFEIKWTGTVGRYKWSDTFNWSPRKRREREWRQEKKKKKTCKEIIAKHFPKWMKDINLQIQEVSQTRSRRDRKERKPMCAWYPNALLMIVESNLPWE